MTIESTQQYVGKFLTIFFLENKQIEHKTKLVVIVSIYDVDIPNLGNFKLPTGFQNLKM